MSEVSTEFEEGVLNHDNTRDINWFLPTASRYKLMRRKPIFNRNGYQTNPLRKNQDPKRLQALSSQVRDKFEFTTMKGDSRTLREQTRRTKTVSKTEK